MPYIRLFKEEDLPDLWQVLKPTFRSGDTYAFPTDISEDQAYEIWVKLPQATYVYLNDEEEITGTYYIKPNQLGPGAHVCNCGYVVSEKARGQGIAPKLNLDSQEEAIKKGYRAMQYNAVVSTNEKAVRLWLSLGFKKVGILPGAFKHPEKGYVDSFVLFKTLVS